MLVDLLVVSDVRLEVVVLVLALVLEGTQLLLKLLGLALSKTQSKKCGLEFLIGSAEIVGLAELVNTGLCRGLLDNELEFALHMAESTTYLGNLRSYICSSNLALILPW